MLPLLLATRLAGTYTVEGTNLAGTTAMTGNAVITEDSPVAVSVTASPDQNNVCQGTSVTIHSDGHKRWYSVHTNGI